MLYSIMIINKAGGLIYYKDCNILNKLTSNEYLVLAGTFHGIHAISQQFIKGSGIECIETSQFTLYCHQSCTGCKFITISSPTGHDGQETRKLYELYCDYVIKNPFYQPEMPIRIELFDIEIQKWISSLNT